MSPFRISTRRTLVAAAAVLVLAGSAVGIAAAQTAPTATPGAAGQARPGYQAFLDALAKRLNISSANLTTAIGQARTDVGLPATGGFPGGGHGEGGPGGRGGRSADLTAAAQAIGITADQLRTELPGKSLAQVAQAHGKTANDVATALKNAANTRIDQEVAAGKLTAADATTRKADTATRIDQMVNEVKPQGGLGGPGGPGGRGFGADLNAAAQASPRAHLHLHGNVSQSLDFGGGGMINSGTAILINCTVSGNSDYVPYAGEAAEESGGNHGSAAHDVV